MKTTITIRNVGFRYAIQPWYLPGRYSEFLLHRYPVGEAQQRHSAASLSPPTKLHPFPTPAVTHVLPEMQCFRHLLAVSDSSTFGSPCTVELITHRDIILDQHLNSNSVEHSPPPIPSSLAEKKQTFSHSSVVFKSDF